MSGGAYLLRLRIQREIRVTVGRLGRVHLPAGDYAYIGSARRGLEARIHRHHRQWRERRDVRRWHIDTILSHPACQWLGVQRFPQGEECALSQALAARQDVSVPVPGFGASDCDRGCPAHFYRLALESKKTNK